MPADVSVDFCGVKMRNPTVLASGILGTSAAILKRVYHEGGAGAVITKSIGPVDRAGWNNPTVIEFDAGFLNAVGLPSQGVENARKELEELRDSKIEWFASVYAGSVEEFVSVSEKCIAFSNAPVLELNLGCPNTKEHGMAFGKDPKVAFDVVSRVKNAVGSKTKVMPKLTPNVNDIAPIAKACEEAGADAIEAINTLAGMAIDVNTGKPILSFKTGGVSGPAIRPVAVYSVYTIRKATQLPILGVGGISKTEHALEMMMAGANAVGIGTGVYYEGIGVFSKVSEGIRSFLEEKGFSSVKQIVGIAQE